MYVLFGVLAVVVVVAAVIWVQPSAFSVVRTTKIKGPPRAAFDLVNDFHQWRVWSPWENIDPNLQRTYSGCEFGLDAIYAWVGNKGVGEGRMTIVESVPPELIRIKLEFLKPFEATNAAEFTFVPEGDETIVTWTMTGTKNFMMKGFGLFMNMDKMIGADFEKGLAGMKSAVESGPKM